MGTVEEWNYELLILFIPVDILLAIFLVLGVTGNSLVIFVYGFKMKKLKDGQYFIPYLAFTDLFGSIICSAFGLSMTLMPVVFDLDYLCKAGWFIGSATTLMSVFLLVIIAIQRYLKVSRQNKPALTLKRKRCLMGLALILSLSLACPSLITYDSVPFESSSSNLTGLICGKITGVGSLVYDIILFIFVSVICGLLIVLYFLVVRKTYKSMSRGQHLNAIVYKSQPGRSNDADDCIIKSPKATKGADLKTDKAIKLDDLVEQNDENTVKIRDLQGNNVKYLNKKVKYRRSQLQKTNKRIISNITLMFMIITVVSLLCSMPKMTMVLLETVVPNFWKKFSDIERAALMFVHQGYILINIINPFIYKFFDKTFQEEMKSLC